MKNYLSSALAITLLLCYSLSVSAQTRIDTLIDFKKHTLHFTVIAGEGTPILFEAGNGDSGEVWESILLPIHEVTGAPLIIYDRAGLGESSIDTTAISFRQEIEDLEQALTRLGYDEELFLVNHSFGAFYNDWFIKRNKRRVQGAVYVDPVSSCFTTEAWSENFVNNISPEIWSMIKTQRRGLYHVLLNLPGITARMRKVKVPKRIPVTVIAAEKILPMVTTESEAAIWRTCLQNLGQGRNRRYVLALGAEHKVWKSRAELVVKEISLLYNEIN